MTRIKVWTTCLLAIATFAAAPAPVLPRVNILRLPNGDLQPQAIVDARGVVHILYFSGEAAHGDVFYTRLGANDTFGDRVRVNNQPGSAIATGNVRGPRFALGRNGRIHVAWNGSDRAKLAADHAAVLYTRSRADDTFEPERNVHQADGPIDGASIAADQGGHVYVGWHGVTAAGKGEADRRFFVTRSADDGGLFGREEAVSPPDAGACGCCGTEGFVDRRGTVYFLFRAARQDVHRETMLLTSPDQGGSFAARALQEWTINACPMSTYALAEGNGVAAAWETAGQVYWSRVDSEDSRMAPIAAPGAGGTRKHPALARNTRGETLLAWTEGMAWSRGGFLIWQLYDSAGAPIGAMGRSDGVPAWSLVTAVARQDGSFTIVY